MLNPTIETMPSLMDEIRRGSRYVDVTEYLKAVKNRIDAKNLGRGTLASLYKGLEGASNLYWIYMLLGPEGQEMGNTAWAFPAVGFIVGIGNEVLFISLKKNQIVKTTHDWIDKLTNGTGAAATIVGYLQYIFAPISTPYTVGALVATGALTAVNIAFDLIAGKKNSSACTKWLAKAWSFLVGIGYGASIPYYFVDYLLDADVNVSVPVQISTQALCGGIYPLVTLVNPDENDPIYHVLSSRPRVLKSFLIAGFLVNAGYSVIDSFYILEQIINDALAEVYNDNIPDAYFYGFIALSVIMSSFMGLYNARYVQPKPQVDELKPLNFQEPTYNTEEVVFVPDEPTRTRTHLGELKKFVDKLTSTSATESLSSCWSSFCAFFAKKTSASESLIIQEEDDVSQDERNSYSTLKDN